MTEAAPIPTRPLPALSLAQQVLANAVCALAVQRIDDDNTDLLIGVLTEILPDCARDSRMADELAAAADQILAAAPTRRQPGGPTNTWTWAMLAASATAHRFLSWRAALALDSHRSRKGVAP